MWRTKGTVGEKIPIYIYIYIEREREREKENKMKNWQKAGDIESTQVHEYKVILKTSACRVYP